jgi:hypothetical protein
MRVRKWVSRRVGGLALDPCPWSATLPLPTRRDTRAAGDPPGSEPALGHPGAEVCRRHLRLIVSLGISLPSQVMAADQRLFCSAMRRGWPLLTPPYSTQTARRWLFCPRERWSGSGYPVASARLACYTLGGADGTGYPHHPGAPPLSLPALDYPGAGPPEAWLISAVLVRRGVGPGRLPTFRGGVVALGVR